MTMLRLFALGTIATLLTAASGAVAAQSPAAPDPGRIVSTAWVAQHLNDPSVRVIATGNEGRYELGHIPGARHIPLGYLPDRFAEIPRSKPIVLQCQSGSRSAIGASLLRARGFDPVINFTGGMSAWVADGRAVDTSSR